MVNHCADTLFERENWCSQQDNDPNHTEKRDKAWFIEQEILLMPVSRAQSNRESGVYLRSKLLNQTSIPTPSSLVKITRCTPIITEAS
jgi:hypothetical protein